MSRYRNNPALLAVIILGVFSSEPYVYAAPLEEVIVTARKRDENLQDVPQAVNVLNSNELADRMINVITELEKVIPNMTMTEAGSQAGWLQVYMRGIGNDNGFDPGVGLYIDDVYLQRAQGGILDIYDVDRIEVLKGPQGNLYGRNTIGGAIKYITREPTEIPEAKIQGKIGRYNLWKVKASGSGPLIQDQLYGGFGMIRTKRDGIQTNQFDGSEAWDIDTYGLRGTLIYTPTENLNVKLGVDYSHDDSTSRIPHLIAADTATVTTIYNLTKSLGNLPANAPPPDFSNIQAGPDTVNSEQDFSAYQLNTFTDYLTFEWAINDEWILKSVTAERTTDQKFPTDFDGSAILFTETLQKIKTDDVSQEFQFNFTGDALDAVAGFFYTDGEQKNPSTGVASPYVYVDRTWFSDIYKSKGLLESWSVYGNADYALTDALQVSLGARYTNDDKSFESRANESFINGTTLIRPPTPDGPVNFGPESKEWTNFSPSGKIAYNVNDETLIYTGIATGFKAGGFNTRASDNLASNTYDPEEVTTYSIGLKTTLLDGSLRFNTEAFYNDYTDKQLTYLLSANGAVAILYTNAGKVTTQGAETEISWLTPVDGLQFDMNLGYLDATIEELDRGGVDVASHSELGFSPRWTVQPYLSYSMAVGEYGDLLFGAAASYRSRSYTNSPVNTDDQNDRQQKTGENIIYDANIVFTSVNGHWRFALEGTNLGDRRVLTSTYNLDLSFNPAATSTYVIGSYNEPRAWALSATYIY